MVKLLFRENWKTDFSFQKHFLFLKKYFNVTLFLIKSSTVIQMEILFNLNISVGYFFF